ncbi:MAG: cell division protein ZipA C-terminal FtsZ-binding domain-containing protein [Sulfuriferula sp.]
MNSLQISLIVLAVVVILAILFYNWFQERKYRKQSMNMLVPHDDVLLQPQAVLVESRIDPVMMTPEVVDAVSQPEPVIDVVDAIEVAESVEPAPATTVVDELPPAPTDAQLEYVISIQTADAIPSAAFAALIGADDGAGKPVRWLGYVPASAAWVDIVPWRDLVFTDVVVAVQLADRAGPVTESQLQNLNQALHQFANRFNGVASWQDIAPVLAKANKLDQFCVDVDVLIGLNVVSNDGESFAGEKIAEVARSAGLVLSDAGVYQRRNERGDVVYALCNHEDTPFAAELMPALQTHGVTLMFEVPRVDNGLAAFAELAQFGQQLALALGGKLVDDNIRPLSPAGIEKIQLQLVHIYQRMEANEIPAGGRRAMRLFN